MFQKWNTIIEYSNSKMLIDCKSLKILNCELIYRSSSNWKNKKTGINNMYGLSESWFIPKERRK